MSDKATVGTTALKKRNIQRLWFILIVVIPAAIIGVYFGVAQAKRPETSVLNKIEEAPIALIVLVAIFLIVLLVYNWMRFDEFERPRYDSSSSFALFASLLLVPWYVAGVQGKSKSEHVYNRPFNWHIISQHLCCYKIWRCRWTRYYTVITTRRSHVLGAISTVF